MRAAAILAILTLVAGCDDSNPASQLPPTADRPLLSGLTVEDTCEVQRF
jgi:hypothetical protein